MKIAVISDIHSNPDALKQALKEIHEMGCSEIICCGDIVGYGYDPNLCIDICREEKIVCVKGNHDAALCGELSTRWFSATAARQIQEQLKVVSEENKKWLSELPYTITSEIAGKVIGYSHGTFSYPDNWDYITDYFSASCELDYLNRHDIDMLFVGHTHDPILWVSTAIDLGMGASSMRVGTESNRLQKLEYEMVRGIYNVGSLGYPRHRKECYYAVIDTDSQKVCWKQIEFNVLEYSKKMEEKGMKIPTWVQWRLEAL